MCRRRGCSRRRGAGTGRARMRVVRGRSWRVLGMSSRCRLARLGGGEPSLPVVAGGGARRRRPSPLGSRPLTRSSPSSPASVRTARTSAQQLQTSAQPTFTPPSPPPPSPTRLVPDLPRRSSSPASRAHHTAHEHRTTCWTLLLHERPRLSLVEPARKLSPSPSLPSSSPFLSAALARLPPSRSKRAAALLCFTVECGLFPLGHVVIQGAQSDSCAHSAPRPSTPRLALLLAPTRLRRRARGTSNGSTPSDVRLWARFGERRHGRQEVGVGGEGGATSFLGLDPVLV